MKDKELRSLLKENFDRIDARFEQMDTRFDQMETRFEARFEQIDARFEQIDARFEQIDARFEQFDARFERVDDEFLRLHTKLDVMAEHFEARLDLHAEGLANGKETLERTAQALEEKMVAGFADMHDLITYTYRNSARPAPPPPVTKRSR
jgi:predicted nuclease with TOPRIM domain